ncbi:MAG: metallopeptidase TldD-related protein [Candidatus Eremiobacteraeota bacterium]|nr:metallopeptidase TldD-related protein [Candidatus Eremiobacteraeota bacterium]
MINDSDSRLIILKAMKKEQKRAFSRITLENFEKPYFIGYVIKEYDSYNIWGRYGALFLNSREKTRHMYCEVRVGSHDFDNTINGGVPRKVLEKAESHKFLQGPIENNINALRLALWRLTDLKYKEALAQYLEKKGRMLNEVIKKKKIPDFSKEHASHHVDPCRPLTFDDVRFRESVRKISGNFRNCRKFINTWVQMMGKKETKFIVNTDGSEIITENFYHVFGLHASALADDGMPLNLTRNFYYRDHLEIPGDDFMERERENLVRDLSNLMKAPLLDPYSGPAIFEPEAAGVFFHEAIGHRLEGERQISSEEGHTFSGKLGERVLSPSLTIVDDPSVKSFGGKSLLGSYLYDDEGIPGQKVTLVKEGILEGYLLSRTPVEGFSHSNGHGRNDFYEFPQARMASFFVHTSDGKSKAELKSLLLKEARRQKKPHGLIIRNVDSGETNTSRYSFQAFSGNPKMVYKVNLSTGRETLVRGVQFVGTPLTSISKIIAAGDTPEVHNAICGAESGWIPVSAIAPAVLVEEIELQKTKEKNKKPPILPPPAIV